MNKELWHHYMAAFVQKKCIKNDLRYAYLELGILLQAMERMIISLKFCANQLLVNSKRLVSKVTDRSIYPKIFRIPFPRISIGGGATEVNRNYWGGDPESQGENR